MPRSNDFDGQYHMRCGPYMNMYFPISLVVKKSHSKASQSWLRFKMAHPQKLGTADTTVGHADVDSKTIQTSKHFKIIFLVHTSHSKIPQSWQRLNMAHPLKLQTVDTTVVYTVWNQTSAFS